MTLNSRCAETEAIGGSPKGLLKIDKETKAEDSQRMMGTFLTLQ